MSFPSSIWLTVTEVAQRLSVSREWVRQLINDGILEVQRSASGNFFIAPGSVERYAAQRALIEKERSLRQLQDQTAQLRETYAFHRHAIEEAQKVLATLPPEVRAQIEQGPPPTFPIPRRRRDFTENYGQLVLRAPGAPPAPGQIAPSPPDFTDNFGLDIDQAQMALNILDQIGIQVTDPTRNVGVPVSDPIAGMGIPVPYWQQQTGFTNPDEVVNWLSARAPATSDSTDILRAAREGRYRPDADNDDGADDDDSE